MPAFGSFGMETCRPFASAMSPVSFFRHLLLPPHLLARRLDRLHNLIRVTVSSAACAGDHPLTTRIAIPSPVSALTDFRTSIDLLLREGCTHRIRQDRHDVFDDVLRVGPVGERIGPCSSSTIQLQRVRPSVLASTVGLSAPLSDESEPRGQFACGMTVCLSVTDDHLSGGLRLGVSYTV